MPRILPCFGVISICLGSAGFCCSATAQQIAPDGSLNTIVNTSNQRDFTIFNGSGSGGNLFHSFREFSIPTGGSATFDLVNTPNASTIFSRVTGNTVSTIDGLIKTVNSSNPISLFLLNPNGILFGANAQLNLGGSFVGTTAERIQFADGVDFGAQNPAPLLTLSVPVGLQLGQNPGPITQQAPLSVAPTKTIALVGGTVHIQGGQLTAVDGRIDLASVAPLGKVAIAATPQPFSLTYPDTTAFQDLTLSQGARLDVGGAQGGNLQLRGHNIALTEGSVVTGRVSQRGVGNRLSITATASLKLAGTNAKGTGASSINAQLGNLATGQGSDIVIRAAKLQLMDGGQIVGGLSGAIGQGGNVSVIADEIEAIGILPPWSPSGITNSLSGKATGRGGNLTVQANKIRLVNGAQIGSGIYDATGQVGDVMIFAPEIEAIGVSANGVFPSAFVNSQGGPLGGNGGNLIINTERLRLINGGQIGTGVYSETGGNAANIQITATDIVISGVDSGGVYNSGIATALVSPIGRGGDLSITTQTLNLSDGAQILSIVSGGQGNAGNITINANQIVAAGVYEPSNYVTGLFTTADGKATGNAGNLHIHTQGLRLSDGAQISAGVTNGSIGNAGNIQITAQTIDLNGVHGKTATRVATLVDTTSKGQGGDIVVRAGEVVLQNGAELTSQSSGDGDAGRIDLTAQSLLLKQNAAINATTTSGNGGSLTLTLSEALLLRHQSLISTEAGGSGNGGNISLRSPFVIGLENSDIVANAFEGRGGNIQITTNKIFGLQNRSERTAANDITASSKLGISGLVQVDSIGIDPNASLIQLSGDMVDSTEQIAEGCRARQSSSFIATGRGGIPLDPSQEASRDRTWQDLRPLSDTRQTSVVESTPVLLVEATKWERDSNGKVQLIAEQLIPPTQIATCAAPGN